MSVRDREAEQPTPTESSDELLSPFGPSCKVSFISFLLVAGTWFNTFSFYFAYFFGESVSVCE